jgi:hypothetical protein
LHVQPDRHAPAQTRVPHVQFEFQNDKASNAGVPLPAGTVRVMSPDRRGTPHLVATTSMADTPEGEKVTWTAGQASDVRVRLTQTDYKTSLGTREGTFVLELRSGAREPGLARVDLHAGSGVEIDLAGPGVTRPSAGTWRVEAALAPGERKQTRFVARRPRQHDD